LDIIWSQASLNNMFPVTQAPPNSTYYVHFPILMLLVSLGLLLLARKLPLVPFVAIWVLQLVLLIPLVLGYTGGV
jgi:hypothetical protein